MSKPPTAMIQYAALITGLTARQPGHRIRLSEGTGKWLRRQYMCGIVRKT